MQKKRAPAFQFYPGDWARDPQLQMATMSTQGVWINLLCKMWDSVNRGILVGTEAQFHKLIGCSEAEFSQFLEENKTLKFATVTISNTIVTVQNRRMVRDEKERNSNALRQKAYRKSSKSNGKVTPPSSTSSSSSTSPSIKKDTNIFYEGKFFSVDNEDALMYMAAYQINENTLWNRCAQMEAWLQANPKKRKKDYPRFINGWLKREEVKRVERPEPQNEG